MNDHRSQALARATEHLAVALARPLDDYVYRAGVIQLFEIAFELAWKTLKDKLEDEGWSPRSPRNTLQLALQSGLIADGRTWLEALEKRNLLAHTYDEAQAERAVTLIRERYFPLLSQLAQNAATWKTSTG